MRTISKHYWVVPAFFLYCFLLLGQASVIHADIAADHKKSESALVPESLIYLDSSNNPGYALVVEMESQTINVYECKDNFTLKHSFPCSTGKVTGKKEKTGDQKTPEGVYFFTKTSKKRYLSPTYGNRAFIMDYPNLLDIKSGRNGDNIWLHGTNKPLKPRDTNGCVAVANGNIDILARYIHLNRTPIIIKKKLRMVSPESYASELNGLLDFLESWKTAFVSGNKKNYSACYDLPSGNIEGLWETWEPMHTVWQSAKIPFRMSFKDMVIARANPCVVALFDQVLSLDHHATTVGTKKLFLQPLGSTWKIVAETYQPTELVDGTKEPLVVSLVLLEQLQKDYKTVAELVTKWAKAWSSEDIKQYGACYAKDFRAKGMDLKAWIRYKKGLHKRYDWIRVSVEDLKIRQDGARSTATFLQRYNSSGLHSVGIKRLRLKLVNGLWKIRRETWYKTENQ